MKTFLTRVDLSNDRQIKQNENTETTFSGSINTLQYSILGQSYSDLKKGVDYNTSGYTNVTLIPTSVIFNFTGTTGSTTYYNIPVIYSSITANLPIITDQNYYGPYDFISSYFVPIETVLVDNNSFDITFSGVEFNFNVVVFGYIGPISGGTFSGICSTNYVLPLSARTYDWYYMKSGSTTWLKVEGRIETDKLTIKQGSAPPSSSYSGSTGDIIWDGDYMYLCVSPNTWRRSKFNSF